jgi:DegV family protein with EDD domain
MKIRIVTDSTSDLQASLASEHGIEIVPLKVMFGEETYRDGIDLNINEFYDKLQHSGVFPSTSQPSPAEFEEVYQRLLSDPDVHIISIHVSSKLSGTLQSAEIALTLLSDEQAKRITIIDSKNACYGLAIFAMEMAKKAADGGSIEECLDLFQRLRSSMRLYFLVDTLEYLQRGGRIGKASAMIGSLLNIKPILTIDEDGAVAPVDKVRGQKQAIKKIIEMCKQQMADRSVHVTLLHSQALSLIEQIGQDLPAQFQVKSINYASIGPVIGTHVGPGALAVIMYDEFA